MSSKSFLSQTIHTIISKGFSLVLVFAAGIITARWLGPEGKGVVALYQALAMMIFPIAELGIRQSTAYFVGKDHSRADEIYSNMQGIYFVVATAVLVILFFTYQSAGLLGEYGWLMAVVFGAVVPFSLFESYHNGVFISKKQIERMNNLVMIDKLATLLFLVAFIILGDMKVLGAGLAYLCSRFVCLFVLFRFLRGEVKVSPRFQWATWRNLLKQGLVFAVALFIIQLNYRFSYILLEHFKGTASLGVYSVGVSLAEILKEIPLALGLVLFSRSANWKHEDIKESLKKVAMLSRLVFLLMLTLGLGWGVVAQVLIPMFYGLNFAGSVAVTWYLLPGIVFLGTFLVLHTFMAGQGKPYYSIIASLPALIINLILCVILIPTLDYRGAALSATISYILGALIYVVIFSKTYGINPVDLIFVKVEDLNFLRNKFTQVRPVLK